MSAKRSASAFQLLTDVNGPEFDYHLELRGGLFFSATTTEEGAKGVGFYVPGAAIASPKTTDLARDAARKLDVEPKNVVWKIVGDPSLMTSATNVLRSAGAVRIEPRAKAGVWELLFSPRTVRVRVASLPEAPPEETGKTRVMIVDDSKTIRNLLEKVLASDPDIEVVGTAEKPSDAEKLLEKLGKSKRPHVITLDIHMPEMDGVTFLKRYLPRYPVPTVMISSISMEEGPMVLSALESGAVDYVQKPSFEQLKDVAPIILEKVKHARHAKVQIARTPRVNSKAVKKTSKAPRTELANDTIIAIGSSTGGTEALRQVFMDLPEEIPPVVVVQHIPPVFSKAFADRMNELCPFEVKEAEDGDKLSTNRILIAPGSTQMKIVKDGNGFKVRIDPKADPVNRHKPSVDVLFDSVAELMGPRAVGVILTGMGADGAKGLLRMRKAGARTLGQDEPSSVVYGMPRAAFEMGAVDRQLPLLEVAGALIEMLKLKKKVA